MNEVLANQLTHSSQQLEQQLPGLGEQLLGYAISLSLFWFLVGVVFTGLPSR